MKMIMNQEFPKNPACFLCSDISAFVPCSLKENSTDIQVVYMEGDSVAVEGDNKLPKKDTDC